MKPGVSRRTKRAGKVEYHQYECGIHKTTGLPGATTLINAKAKGWQLQRWIEEQPIRAAIAEMDTLAMMLRTGTEQGVIEYLRSVSEKRRNDAGDKGTRVHAACEAIVKDEEPVVASDIENHVEGFRRWLADSKAQVRASEFMVVSETERYGATGDLVAVIGGSLWLLDIKTGGAYPEAGLQLAAIRYADHAGVEGDEREYRVPPATHFGVLHATDTGTELVPYDVRPDEEWRAFLACRDVYEWERFRSKSVIGKAAA